MYYLYYFRFYTTVSNQTSILMWCKIFDILIIVKWYLFWDTFAISSVQDSHKQIFIEIYLNSILFDRLLLENKKRSDQPNQKNFLGKSKILYESTYGGTWNLIILHKFRKLSDTSNTPGFISGQKSRILPKHLKKTFALKLCKWRRQQPTLIQTMD